MNKLLLLCVLVLAGCAGQTARQKVLKPAIQEGWASIRTDAVDPSAMDEAVVDCACPELVTVWLATEVNPTGDTSTKAETVETIRQLNRAINLYCKEGVE